MAIYFQVWFHGQSNHSETNLLEQEWPGIEPRTSGFKTGYSAIEQSHLLMFVSSEIVADNESLFFMIMYNLYASV